ncbi:ChrR family anti-sigma-E factor [Thalassotalea sp. SU-HH00458]|uniref:ChrR family anti-sigma-E factor n=1 Tax=Thalassotalea sp. SU-HH00458 TaxID=3127657 RepID=UPI0031022053
MIKHHPKLELIQAFVDGDLPASLSAGIAMHAEMCPQCQEKIVQLTEHAAEVSFEEGFLDKFIVDDSSNNDIDFEAMANLISQSDDIAISEPILDKSIVFNDTTYQLPKVLNNMTIGNTINIGKLSRARLQLDENEIHTSLLEIKPGGGVPEHTHKGFELTLLLDGSFHDEKGEYTKGDFIMLDSSHQHHPVSNNGCLCYTVANDALHFTQGINKLLNPIGALIY